MSENKGRPATDDASVVKMVNLVNNVNIVKLTFRGEAHEVEAGITLRQALEALQLNRHTVLGVRRGKVITDDTILNAGDEIKLVALISGG